MGTIMVCRITALFACVWGQTSNLTSLRYPTENKSLPLMFIYYITVSTGFYSVVFVNNDSYIVVFIIYKPKD